MASCCPFSSLYEDAHAGKGPGMRSLCDKTRGYPPLLVEPLHRLHQIEARQRKKRVTCRSSIVNVWCNPKDVIFTTNLLNPQQYAAIEADGFGHLLRMKIDAVENKNLLTWLLDHTDPDRMLIRIGAGKVLPITPQIISMVLGLPIGGENFEQYSWKEDSCSQLARLTFYDNALIDRLTAADTTITTDGAHTFGVEPFKPWSTTCYAAADVRGAPYHNINVPAAGIPNLDIPRLQDFLSEPIDDLTGPHRERVRGFFFEFDHTLSQNKRSIENSIANIVRAQFLDDLPMFKFPGKRLTKKPSKFYSPFKHGILSRPPPNL
ncbi:unnamed protein product [Miscanthus lutarioriparius]|uniref:Uncharacterized protein n=1 Tax=Miscanthus lutarioriparius TaxID=422564 RepID=A0A811S7N5_9POAL|nr:unnamed protein product [Miscanthus lutarioriparius]